MSLSWQRPLRWLNAGRQKIQLRSLTKQAVDRSEKWGQKNRRRVAQNLIFTVAPNRTGCPFRMIAFEANESYG